jgi:hypothetical protein
VLDMLCNNEGQESCVLLGNPAFAAYKTPVTLFVAGSGGVTGSRVRVLDQEKKALLMMDVSGGEGRGGHHSPSAHFALDPGTYYVEARYTNGVTRCKQIQVARAPVRSAIDDKTPLVE